MGVFRKKKKALFGTNIAPDCSYCSNNAGKENAVVCTRQYTGPADSCKKFQYNPLMRKPRPKPSVRTSGLTEKDFSL